MLRGRRGPIQEALKIPAVWRIVLAFHALTLGEWVLEVACSQAQHYAWISER